MYASFAREMPQAVAQRAKRAAQQHGVCVVVEEDHQAEQPRGQLSPLAIAGQRADRFDQAGHAAAATDHADHRPHEQREDVTVQA